MIAEQLQAARAAHWRQKQDPILTLEDAQGWLLQHPLCLYLPRHAQLPAPAPSFVEACLGSRTATPGPAAIEHAQGLLTRLAASGTVVALNLLGGMGEQADFLAHQDALPSVLSLRSDKDWKHAPQKSSGHKVSPLVLELWKILDTAGVLTAAAAREALGRELTEAAVLRALGELWQGLRISPVYAEDGGATQWEMLRVRHRAALGTAGTTGQVTAISLLVSMYLQSVYAATSEEIEVFLSPVASRSRVREAVRGLSATRQIQSLSMDAQTFYFLEGGLPEFVEPAAPAVPEGGPEPRRRQAITPPLSAPPVFAPTVPRGAPVAPPPGVGPTAAPMPRRAPQARPASPAAKGGWRSPGRPAGPARPPWRPSGKPPATGPSPRWAGKEGGGATADKRFRPAPGSRPNPRDARPGQRPAPFPRTVSRPAQTSGSAPRPGTQVGRGNAPFRKPQKRYDRPTSARGPVRDAAAGIPARGGGPPRFRPRPPLGKADSGRTTPYRAAGRPSGPAPGRPSGPTQGRPSGRASGYPSERQEGRAPAGNRPPRSPASGRPQSFPPRENRGGRPGGGGRFNPAGRPRPAASSAPSRSSGHPRAGGPARPGAPARFGGPPGGRSGPPPAGDRGANRRGSFDRPRPGGSTRGAKPATGGKPGANRPFAPRTGAPKPWASKGKSTGKPGKPNFRGGKPARKKPGV